MKWEMALKVLWTNREILQSTDKLSLHMQIRARSALPPEDLTIAAQAKSVVTYSLRRKRRRTRRSRGNNLVICLPEFYVPLTCPWIGRHEWRVEIQEGIRREVTEFLWSAFSIFITARVGFCPLHGGPCSCRQRCLFCIGGGRDGGGSTRMYDSVVPPGSL
jgi:hypothetical protein